MEVFGGLALVRWFGVVRICFRFGCWWLSLRLPCFCFFFLLFLLLLFFVRFLVLETVVEFASVAPEARTCRDETRKTRHRGRWCEMIATIKKLCTSYKPIFTKIPKYCFNTSNGTETITVSILFRRLQKTVFFYPPGIGKTPNSHKLEAHSKIAIPVDNRGPRGTANAQLFFYLWAKCRCTRALSQLCCEKVAL